MFGYVRARRDMLPASALADYDAAYCGLCHTMDHRHGFFSRLFLNYDFALLAMLLAPTDAECKGICRKCPAHPIQGRPASPAGKWLAATDAECKGICRKCPAHPIQGRPASPAGKWLDVAADESVVLTVWKLRDTVADGSFFARLGAQLLLLGLRRGHRIARESCPAFDAQVSHLLSELRGLEEGGCSSVDQTSDCFARLLSAAAPQTGDGVRDRAMAQLLYHLGRWIYLIDAVDDLPGDRKAGCYNPLTRRFPDWTEGDRAYLRRNMDHSLALAGAAFQLLGENRWSPVVENILYCGLPGVEELVFSGQWRDYQKRHRRNDP